MYHVIFDAQISFGLNPIFYLDVITLSETIRIIQVSVLGFVRNLRSLMGSS